MHLDDSPSFQVVMPGLERPRARHPRTHGASPARGMAGSSSATTILVNLVFESDHWIDVIPPRARASMNYLDRRLLAFGWTI